MQFRSENAKLKGMNIIKPCLAGVALLALVILPSHAEDNAQEETADESPRYEPADGWNISIGAAAHYRPEYEGSDDHDLRALPLIDIEYNDWFFANTRDGAGVYAWFKPQSKGWLALQPRFSRGENDSPALRGLGDIDAALLLVAGSSYLSPVGEFSMSIHQDVSGADIGYFLQGNFVTRVDFTPRFIFSPTLDVIYAGDDFMQQYFGITNQQAANSDYDSYDAEAGLQSIGTRLRFIGVLTPQWQWQTMVMYHRLFGDAADSPITQSSNQYQVISGLTYRF